MIFNAKLTIFIGYLAFVADANETFRKSKIDKPDPKIPRTQPQPPIPNEIGFTLG
jgi:hypothetical protein